MKNGAVGLIVLLNLFSANVDAASWTSSDGKIGFDLPADGSLVSVKYPPAPVNAMWASPDGTARLAYLTQPNPQNLPIDVGAFLEGAVKGLPNATVTSSSDTTLGDVPVLSIEIKTTGGYLKQTAMAFSNNIYKIMAISRGPIVSDARFATVFQLLAVRDLSPMIPQRPRPPLDRNKLFGQIGAGGFGMIIVGLIIRAGRKKSRRPPPLP